MIPLFYPQIYKEEWLAELSQVFDTRWIGQGPLVDEFEKQFAQKFGYDYCLALNSGSAALELAYDLAGIGEGDEVITTVFTCTATNIPLLRRKARIVFADINDQLLLDFDDLKIKVNGGTKAIVVVTLGGLPVDPRIFELAAHYHIPVIVDAAQSLGTTEWEGDYVCYSFQAIKHFTCGDGGMLVCRNGQDHDRAKRLRWFGIDREAKKQADWKCMVNHQMAMEIEEAGYKFHMNDIAAAMGLVGLRHSDEILKQRREICNAYIASGLGIDWVCGGSYWLFAVLTENRDDLADWLRNNKVESDPVQLRNDIFQVFGGKRQDLPNMNRLENQYLYLPLNCQVDAEAARRIGKQVRRWVQNGAAAVDSAA